MLDKWLASLVINFILRQLSKFAGTIDWAKVKLDAEARIAALIPGTMFDDEAKAFVAALIDGAKSVLSSTAQWDAILHLVVAQNYTAALEALTALLKHVWLPTDPAGVKAKALLVL